jgi:hypothetical protein
MSIIYGLHRGSIELVPDISWIQAKGIALSGSIDPDPEDAIIHRADDLFIVARRVFI